MNSDEPQPVLAPAELPRQLTNDAVLAAVDGRITTVEMTLRDIRREQREDHNAVREDIKQLREVTAQTLEEVRQVNASAATALRLATSNAQDIEALQSNQLDGELALAVLPEGGGLRALVHRVLELGRSHEDAALASDTKRNLLSTQVKWFMTGVTVTGGIVSVVGAVAGWF